MLNIITLNNLTVSTSLILTTASRDDVKKTLNLLNVHLIYEDRISDDVLEHYNEPLITVDLKSNQIQVIIPFIELNNAVDFYINEHFKRFECCNVKLILAKPSDLQFVEVCKKLLINHITNIQITDLKKRSKEKINNSLKQSCKEKNNLIECSSYQLILLFNVDNKIKNEYLTTEITNYFVAPNLFSALNTRC